MELPEELNFMYNYTILKLNLALLIGLFINFLKIGDYIILFIMNYISNKTILVMKCHLNSLNF